MKVGLFFGTFNPIHVGHLIIAEYMAGLPDLDQVWMVVTPQNPLKKKSSLLADYHRLALVQVAIEDNEKLRVSDIEFKLPQPNYTIMTLEYLKEKHPGYEFSLILGEDNLDTFHKWFNYEKILSDHRLIVYPRLDNEHEDEEKMHASIAGHPNIMVCKDAPLMKISSTFVRDQIRSRKSVRYVLTDPVMKYIEEMNFYK